MSRRGLLKAIAVLGVSAAAFESPAQPRRKALPFRMGFVSGTPSTPQFREAFTTQKRELWRTANSYVDRILRGANPADLPIQLPARFVFTVNLKTAATIGLKLPQSIVLRADRIVE